jgi:hypothetical protein
MSNSLGLTKMWLPFLRGLVADDSYRFPKNSTHLEYQPRSATV